MRTEPSGTELIERYLRTRRMRYFPGQHDGAFFFLATAADHCRLHVHLEVSQVDPDIFTIHVTPAYFFASAHRAALVELATAWNQHDRSANAILCESSDPNRVGVVAENSTRISDVTDFDDFSMFVDRTIQSAVDLFGEIARSVALTVVRNAG